jgi:hypothetical protein
MTAIPSQGPGPDHPASRAIRQQVLNERERQLSRLFAQATPDQVAAAIEIAAMAPDGMYEAEVRAFRAELDDDLTEFLAPDPDEDPR